MRTESTEYAPVQESPTACVSAGLSLEPCALRPRALYPLRGYPTCAEVPGRVHAVGTMLQEEFPARDAAQGVFIYTDVL